MERKAEDQGGNTNRRGIGRFLLNPKFQVGFVAALVGISLFNCFVIFTAIESVFSKFTGEGVKLGLQPGSAFFLMINNQHYFMNTVFIFVCAANIVVIALAGIVLSHRIVGPIYKMCKHLKSIKDLEDLKEVHFRKRDHFLEMQDAFNKFVVRINGKSTKGPKSKKSA